ncbi:hypothetical protein NDU88_003294 [Pleurodeles waltl]|uniref:Uncharacterized protein n=1 Tax=Pleurodeles waltl TaxID=8319 RepID=A0AAV7NGF3_PLEWA|nr:hypothetical protein NDU88_003294 [Pleurodeles waltl]
MDPDLQTLSSTLLRKNRCYEVTLDPGRKELSWRDLQPRRNRADCGVADRAPICDALFQTPAPLTETFVLQTVPQYVVQVGHMLPSIM